MRTAGKEAVEGILNDIGTNVKEIEEGSRGDKEIKRCREGGTEMIWVRLESEEQKRKVMERKNNLRCKKERITEDLT